MYYEQLVQYYLQVGSLKLLYIISVKCSIKPSSIQYSHDSHSVALTKVFIIAKYTSIFKLYYHVQFYAIVICNMPAKLEYKTFNFSHCLPCCYLLYIETLLLKIPTLWGSMERIREKDERDSIVGHECSL